jgi:hypothetical protein
MLRIARDSAKLSLSDALLIARQPRVLYLLSQLAQLLHVFGSEVVESPAAA